jgi:uncharacterized membrane protein (DUF106 family)
MTTTAASEIIRLATTVATVQLCCNWIANRFWFGNEDYRRAVDALERTKWSVQSEQAAFDKASTSPASTKSTILEMHSKRLTRAKESLQQAQANLAAHHVLPNVATSIVFVILFRILAVEFGGRVLAILPFAPFSLLYKLTGRGLEFGPDASVATLESPLINDLTQAASFIIIYILCNTSIKAYTSKLFGIEPPPGAEGAHMERIWKQFDPENTTTANKKAK